MLARRLYDQLKQQLSQTEVEKEAFSSASQKTSQDYVAAARLNRCLTKAVPTYNEGEEHGIENWVARCSSTPGSSPALRPHRTTRTAS